MKRTRRSCGRPYAPRCLRRPHSRDFSSLLLREGVAVKESRGRLSYLTPDRTKPITARKLGDDFERAAVLAVLEQNAARTAEKAQLYPVRRPLSKTNCGQTEPPEPPRMCSGLWTLSRRKPRAKAGAMNAGRPCTPQTDGRDAECVSGIRLYFPEQLEAPLILPIRKCARPAAN